MRIVCISDTHGRHAALDVPPGDVLLHAGDLGVRGTLEEIDAFDAWMATLPHRHRLVIAGNHDWAFQRTPDEAKRRLRNATYLEDSGITIDGIRFWGSPWQPAFLGWAFNLPRGAPLAERWARIPTGTDVVITHGPPMGYGDRCWHGRRVGCEDLLPALLRAEVRLHVCGHIHEDHGQRRHGALQLVNASVCTLRYRPVQPAIVVDLPPRSHSGDAAATGDAPRR